jgi:hypothetical protein
VIESPTTRTFAGFEAELAKAAHQAASVDGQVAAEAALTAGAATAAETPAPRLNNVTAPTAAKARPNVFRGLAFGRSVLRCAHVRLDVAGASVMRSAVFLPDQKGVVAPHRQGRDNLHGRITSRPLAPLDDTEHF